MAAGNAAPRALLVVALVSFLLIQGVAGEFECCYCNCYEACKRGTRLGKDKEACHHKCFDDQSCRFSCKNRRCHSSYNDGDLVSPRMDVAVAAGGDGDGQGEAVNGTKVGAAP